MSANLRLNDRYHLLEPVGSGGMALVYKAEDLLLGRPVAVKVLRDSLLAEAAFLARFQQEARSAAQLGHPNIVTVHDFGQDNGRYYIVMEWVEGVDLKRLIREAGPFEVQRAVDVAIELCAGLGHAHRAGLVHCDIKPQNVLIAGDGRAKLTDFGIARALAAIQPGDTTDVVWGSPHYFSPEQAAGEVPTPPSDVYSLGVVLYEMLAGRVPFQGDSHQALGRMHQRDDPPPMSLYNPAVPDALERIVRKVLSKEPSARYRTADQLGHILSTYRERGLAANSSIPPLDRADPPKPLPPPNPPRPAGRPPFVPRSRSPSQVQPAAPAMPSEAGMDWLALFLGFVAFVAVAGLVGVWALVFYQLIWVR